MLIARRVTYPRLWHAVAALIPLIAIHQEGANAVQLTSVSATPRLAEDGRTYDILVRWITDVPTVGLVEYGPTAAHGQRTEAEPEPCNNHRTDIRSVPRGQRRHLRIVCQADDAEAASDDIEVVPPRGFPKAAKSGRVRLTVAEPSGVARGSAPLTVGLPLPRGALGDASNVRLLDPGGAALPLQTRSLSRWPDGSIKWILLDTRLDLAAGERVTLTLQYGGDARLRTPAPAITVTEERYGIVVDTGPLQAQIPLGAGEGTITVRGQAAARLPVSVLADISGKVFVGRAERAYVEEAGPLRTVVRIDGHHVADDGERLFGYTLRLFFFAGKDVIRVDHVFANDNMAEEMTAIRWLDVSVPLLRGAGAATVGAGAGQTATITAQDRLFQYFDDAFVVEPGPGEGKRADGWAQADGETPVTVFVRDFWQHYPKSLAVTDEALVVGVCPRITPPDRYADREDEHKLFYHLRDGNYTFRLGLEKRHELWISFADTPPEALAAAVQRPLLAVADPQWYADSGALRDILPAHPERFAMYDEAASANLDRFLELREDGHEYGLMNYGDWYGERRYNWGNIEYDLQHCLLVQYLRSGQRKFFDAGEAAARHCMDIDVVHHAKGQVTEPTWTGPRRVGQVWVHSMGHTGGYYPKEYRDMGVYALGYSTNTGHMWSQGILDYYCLSGDRRALECALQVSDWVAGPYTTNFNFGNARQPGWMTILVMSAYYVTSDRYYLNAAKIMLDKVYEKAQETKPETGLYYHKLGGGHCRCEQSHYGEAGFMAAVLMTGMKMYYLATGDERVADAIVKIANFIIDTMYVPEEGTFHYTSCPKSSVGASYGFLLGDGLGFAANRTNDERLIEVTKAAVARSMQAFSGTGGGKSIGFAMCAAPYAMSETDKLPGAPFDEYHAEAVAGATDPGRRPVPCLVPNPGFEESCDGWRTRGALQLSRSTDVAHTGTGCAAIKGTVSGANEYLVTYYGSGSPWEITWLEPGEKYRFVVWMRLDSVSPGAPAPTARVSIREHGVSKEHVHTTPYDLARLGTWQRLAADFTMPEWGTSVYLAANTHTQESVDVTLYVDDFVVVPAAAPERATYVYMAAEAESARRSGAELGRLERPPAWPYLTPGGPNAAASFSIDVPFDDEYRVLLRAATQGRDGPGSVLRLSVDGREAGDVSVEDTDWQWVGTGEAMRLRAGTHEVHVAWEIGKARVQRIVLTNELVGD